MVHTRTLTDQLSARQLPNAPFTTRTAPISAACAPSDRTDTHPRPALTRTLRRSRQAVRRASPSPSTTTVHYWRPDAQSTVHRPATTPAPPRHLQFLHNLFESPRATLPRSNFRYPAAELTVRRHSHCRRRKYPRPAAAPYCGRLPAHLGISARIRPPTVPGNLPLSGRYYSSIVTLCRVIRAAGTISTRAGVLFRARTTPPGLIRLAYAVPGRLVSQLSFWHHDDE